MSSSFFKPLAMDRRAGARGFFIGAGSRPVMGTGTKIFWSWGLGVALGLGLGWVFRLVLSLLLPVILDTGVDVGSSGPSAGRASVSESVDVLTDSDASA